MKEIGPIAGIDSGATIKMTIGRKTIDCKIIMKEIGPITEMIGTEIGITCKIIMKETHLIVGIKCETTMKVTIGMKIIDCNIIMKEIGPITEAGHTVEIGHEATTKMTIETTMKMIIGMTVEMTIRKPIKVTLEEKIVGISEMRGIKEVLETIVKTSVKMGI